MKKPLAYYCVRKNSVSRKKMQLIHYNVAESYETHHFQGNLSFTLKGRTYTSFCCSYQAKKPQF